MADHAAVVRRRHSCRAYLNEPVPRSTLVELFELAQRSPSWCNSQPWDVIVTEGDGTERFRTGLTEHARSRGSAVESDVAMPETYSGVYLQRRRESGWQLYEAAGIARGDRAASAEQAFENFRFFGAPHVAIITVEAALGPYAILDTGLYVANLLLAAESLGLGATPQAALARFSPFVRQHFGIPEHRDVLLGVSLGLPDRSHPVNGYRTSRADVDDVVTWVTT